jgi:hypothetical protein
MQIRVVEREVQEHREKEAAKEEEEKRKSEEAAATAVAQQQQEHMEVEEQPVSTQALLAPSAIQHQPPSSEVGLGFADQSVAVAPISSHVSG